MAPFEDDAGDDLLRIGFFWPTSRSVVVSPYICEQNPHALDLEEHQRMAREVEAAGFDFALLSDGYGVVHEASSRIGHHDPSMHAVLWALPLFAVTSRLGFLSTMHSTFIETIDLAQYGAQLDHVSGGRWGWNVTTGYRPEEPKLFGGSGLSDHDERYGIAEEAVAVCRQLWREGSPEVHADGEYRRVDGRLPGPAPRTGRGPLIVNAGASDHGIGLAGRHCDYLFANVVEHSDVKELNQRMRVEGEAVGRTRFTQVLAGIQCLIRDTAEEALDEWEVLQASVASSDAMRVFSEQMAKGSKSSAAASARRGALEAQDRKPGIAPLVGTADQVAAQIVERYHEHGYRGFLVQAPYWSEGEMARYGKVFELLEEAGVWAPTAKRASLW